MAVHISMERNRVLLRAKWHPGLPARCKEIPGFNWSKTKEAWTYPLSMATLRQMRAVFGDELKVDPELWAWAKAQRKAEKRTKAYSAHHDAVLQRVPNVAPVLAKAMEDRTYQRSAARFATVAGNFLLADEPGLGKTACAIAAIIESGRWEGEHLVSAPKTSLESTWARQIREWTGATAYAMPEGAARRAKMLDAYMADPSATKFLIVNPDMLRRLYDRRCKKCDIWESDVKAEKVQEPLSHHIETGHKYTRAVRQEAWPDILNHDWSTLVVDESHELFAAYTPANVTQAVAGILDVKADTRIALTGTPLRGQEKNLWGTLDFLGVNTGGYWPFMNSYMEVSSGFFGAEVYGLDPSRANEFHKLVDRYVLRRTRAEARPDLPLGQRVDVMVEMSAAHAKQYREFEAMGEAELASGTLFGKGLLSEMTRLKQLAYGTWVDAGEGQLRPKGESPKREWLVEWLAARGVTGKKTRDWMPEPGTAYKYVVASQLTEIIDDVEANLNKRGIKTLRITGSVTGRRRTDAITKFQSKDTEYRVMLLQTQTGGVAVDLDAWCDEMVILDETFVADEQVQLEGRINNRSGRVSPRMWWYVRTADTIEQKIAESNYAQHVTEHNLLDGRRGVKVALHLLAGD
jgi:SNF2 family DNA or RNA helicase